MVYFVTVAGVIVTNSVLYTISIYKITCGRTKLQSTRRPQSKYREVIRSVSMFVVLGRFSSLKYRKFWYVHVIMGNLKCDVVFLSFSVTVNYVMWSVKLIWYIVYDREPTNVTATDFIASRQRRPCETSRVCAPPPWWTVPTVHVTARTPVGSGRWGWGGDGGGGGGGGGGTHDDGCVTCETVYNLVYPIGHIFPQVWRGCSDF